MVIDDCDWLVSWTKLFKLEFKVCFILESKLCLICTRNGKPLKRYATSRGDRFHRMKWPFLLQNLPSMENEMKVMEQIELISERRETSMLKVLSPLSRRWLKSVRGSSPLRVRISHMIIVT